MEKCKALMIARDKNGKVVYAVNLWHEQSRNRRLDFDNRLKAQLKVIKAKRRAA